MFRQASVVSRGLACVRAIALFVMLLSATAVDSKPTSGANFGGLVAIADGEPFTIIRGANLETATRGVTLAAGDIIETGTGAFLAIEMPGGSLLGIGPSTRLYLMQRTDTPTIVVLSGWVKVTSARRRLPYGCWARGWGFRAGRRCWCCTPINVPTRCSMRRGLEPC